MINLKYLIPRVIRHFLPSNVARFLLLKRWIIKPGIETDSPEWAAARYQKVLSEKGITLAGKSFLILGYGGRFAVGCNLLKMGAKKVILCEKGVQPDDVYNRELLEGFSSFLKLKNNQVRPDSSRMEVIEGDIRMLETDPVDIILSTSVYEHLDDVEGITRALAALTKTDGINLHYIDLRDHFFKYPFEMLCYSEKVWSRWLNPTTHHNRYRFTSYRAAFEEYFGRVEVIELERNEEEFEKARERIQPEFLSGDYLTNTITKATLMAFGPKRIDRGL